MSLLEGMVKVGGMLDVPARKYGGSGRYARCPC